jgi:hypothetical protein
MALASSMGRVGLDGQNSSVAEGDTNSLEDHWIKRLHNQSGGLIPNLGDVQLNQRHKQPNNIESLG